MTGKESTCPESGEEARKMGGLGEERLGESG